MKGHLTQLTPTINVIKIKLHHLKFCIQNTAALIITYLKYKNLYHTQHNYVMPITSTIFDTKEK